MTIFVGGDGEGVIGGVNREERSCSWSAMDSSMSIGIMDFRSGVGGGVSGLTRCDNTGRARFCCGNRSNNSLKAFLSANRINGCYYQSIEEEWHTSSSSFADERSLLFRNRQDMNSCNCIDS